MRRVLPGEALMQAVETLKTDPVAKPRWRFNGRLIIALLFDLAAWGLLIAAGWGALRLLKLA